MMATTNGKRKRGFDPMLDLPAAKRHEVGIHGQCQALEHQQEACGQSISSVASPNSVLGIGDDIQTIDLEQAMLLFDCGPDASDHGITTHTNQDLSSDVHEHGKRDSMCGVTPNSSSPGTGNAFVWGETNGIFSAMETVREMLSFEEFISNENDQCLENVHDRVANTTHNMPPGSSHDVGSCGIDWLDSDLVDFEPASCEERQGGKAKFESCRQDPDENKSQTFHDSPGPSSSKKRNCDDEGQSIIELAWKMACESVSETLSKECKDDVQSQVDRNACTSDTVNHDTGSARDSEPYSHDSNGEDNCENNRNNNAKEDESGSSDITSSDSGSNDEETSYVNNEGNNRIKKKESVSTDNDKAIIGDVSDSDSDNDSRDSDTVISDDESQDDAEEEEKIDEDTLPSDDEEDKIAKPLSIPLPPKYRKLCPHCGLFPTREVRQDRYSKLKKWKEFFYEDRHVSAEERREEEYLQVKDIPGAPSRYAMGKTLCKCCKFPLPVSPLALQRLPQSMYKKVVRRERPEKEVEERLLLEVLQREHEKHTERNLNSSADNVQLDMVDGIPADAWEDDLDYIAPSSPLNINGAIPDDAWESEIDFISYGDEDYNILTLD